MHYHRWYRKGDPLATPFGDKPKYCCVDDCSDERHYTNGLCKVHYMRLRNTGQLDLKPRPAPTGSVTSQGYRVRKARRHPIANVCGSVFEHRMFLYDAIGPGIHPCNWCGTPVSWEKSWPVDPDALVVDHLDRDRLNNSLDNLVPSCFWCNRGRD